jgi:hypothetical protein
MSAHIALPQPITADGATGALAPDANADTIVVTVDVAGITEGTAITFAARRSGVFADFPVDAWSTAVVRAEAVTAPGTVRLELPPNIDPAGHAARWYQVTWSVSGESPSVTATANAEG